MTFLNSAGLLNMANADAVKTAASNPSQDLKANQSEEFAQALRKQLQQANKPASPMVDAKNKQPLKESMHAQSAQASANTVKNEPAPKEPPKTNASAKENSTRGNDGEQQKSVSESDQSQSAKDQAALAEEATGINETALDIKKRLITDLQATDPATTASITPWMQTMTAMIALRHPSSENIADNQTGIAMDAAAMSLQAGELVVDPAATALPEAALADKALTTNMTADLNTGAQPVTVAVDSKTATVADSQTPVAEKPTNFSETLGIAKSVADAVRETIVTDKAVSAADADIQADTSNTITLPAAQAMPNSPWLNTAGISQNANVFMSQVATPFGNERWQTAMNQHVLNMVGSGDDVASLTLSPPDLGPIQVVLKVDNQSVNTSFITDNPLVRQALEDGMQDLRDRMQSQGLELGQTFVGNGEQAQQHFEQSAKGNFRSAATSAEAETTAVTPAAVKTTVSRGLVDTFA